MDANGNTVFPWGPPGNPATGLIAQSGWNAGQTRHFQCNYREGVNFFCMTGLNTPNGVSVTFAP